MQAALSNSRTALLCADKPTGYGSSIRRAPQTGIVDECCFRSCDLRRLEMYCAPLKPTKSARSIRAQRHTDMPKTQKVRVCGWDAVILECSFIHGGGRWGTWDADGNSVLCFLDDRSKGSNATNWMAYRSILPITRYCNLSFSLLWTIWHLKDGGKQGLNLSKPKLPSEASLPNSIPSLSYQCGNGHI